MGKKIIPGDYILLFDEHPEISKQSCINMAEGILNGPVTALGWQGCHSYTLESKDQETVVQFRSAESPLDPERLDMARSIHGSLVPSSNLVGNMSGSTVTIWKMDKVPAVGLSYLHHVPDFKHKLLGTVEDIAHYLARAWKAPQPVTPERRTEIYLEYDSQLAELSTQHPDSDLKSKIDHLRTRLRDILHSLPWVLAHNDMEAMNLLFDEQTLRLRGIVDWADATILPFGWDLTVLDVVLGYCNDSGWHWHVDDVQSYRKAFAETFFAEVGDLSSRTCQDIEDVCALSVVFHYGRYWQNGKWVAVDEDDNSTVGNLLRQDAIFT